MGGFWHRYILKVTISRHYASNIVKEKDFWVGPTLHSHATGGRQSYTSHPVPCQVSGNDEHKFRLPAVRDKKHF